MTSLKGENSIRLKKIPNMRKKNPVQNEKKVQVGKKIQSAKKIPSAEREEKISTSWKIFVRQKRKKKK